METSNKFNGEGTRSGLDIKPKGGDKSGNETDNQDQAKPGLGINPKKGDQAKPGLGINPKNG